MHTATKQRKPALARGGLPGGTVELRADRAGSAIHGGASVPAARVSCPWDLIAFGREMVSFTEFATVLLPATSREQKSLERCVRFKIPYT